MTQEERTDWLDDLHKAEQIILDERIRAADVASAIAYMAPESRAVKSLADMCQRLRLAAELVHRASGNAVTESVRNAKQSSRNMLNAALAGLAARGVNDPDVLATVKTVHEAIFHPQE